MRNDNKGSTTLCGSRGVWPRSTTWASPLRAVLRLVWSSMKNIWGSCRGTKCNHLFVTAYWPMMTWLNIPTTTTISKLRSINFTCKTPVEFMHDYCLQMLARSTIIHDTFTPFALAMFNFRLPFSCDCASGSKYPMHLSTTLKPTVLLASLDVLTKT